MELVFRLRLAALNDTICLLRAIVHSEQLYCRSAYWWGGFYLLRIIWHKIMM